MHDNKPTIKDLSFSELAAIRSNFYDQMKGCEDTQFVPKIDCLEKHATLKAEIERIDSFILRRYTTLKDNATKKS